MNELKKALEDSEKMLQFSNDLLKGKGAKKATMSTFKPATINPNIKNCAPQKSSTLSKPIPNIISSVKLDGPKTTDFSDTQNQKEPNKKEFPEQIDINRIENRTNKNHITHDVGLDLSKVTNQKLISLALTKNEVDPNSTFNTPDKQLAQNAFHSHKNVNTIPSKLPAKDPTLPSIKSTKIGKPSSSSVQKTLLDFYSSHTMSTNVSTVRSKNGSQITEGSSTKKSSKKIHSSSKHINKATDRKLTFGSDNSILFELFNQQTAESIVTPGPGAYDLPSIKVRGASCMVKYAKSTTIKKRESSISLEKKLNYDIEVEERQKPSQGYSFPKAPKESQIEVQDLRSQLNVSYAVIDKTSPATLIKPPSFIQKATNLAQNQEVSCVF